MFRSILRLTRFSTPTSSPASSSRHVGTVSDILAIIGSVHPSPSPSSRCVRLLRRCLRSDNSLAARAAHAHVLKLGLDDDTWVWNVLLDFYSKAGLFDSAVNLFDEMPVRDIVTWCTLLSGFARHGFGLEANMLFKRFVEMGLLPNCFVASSALRGCSVSGSLELGIVVHGMVVKCGLGFDKFVEIGLVDMYGKCGALDDALKVFYEIPIKCSVAWNAAVSGCVQNGCFLEATELFQEMRRIGLFTDVVTLRVVASAAAALEMLNLCTGLHVYSIKTGFDRDTFVVAELVRLLSKLGKVKYMSKLFKMVKRPDVSLYSLLISGFNLHGHKAEALRLAEEVLALDSNPKQGALINVINLCAVREEGTQVHARIIKSGYVSCLCVGNALISMYFKFGELWNARATFLRMPVRDLVSWTAIMTGLAQNLKFGEALETFVSLCKTKLRLDQHCVATTVTACTGLQHIVKGQQVHALSVKLGFEFSKYVTATLLHMYAKCGYIESACRLYIYASLFKDLVLANIMLAGYCWNFQPLNAIQLFSREYQAGMIADQFCYSTILGACADVKSSEIGEQIHCQVTKSGLESSDAVIGNSIINMYIKCGSMASACKFFYSLKRRNTTSFEMLMTGYIQNRGSSKALQIFHQMQQSGFQASPVTFARILRGCADLAAIDLGKQIHASIMKMGLISDLTVGSALVGMYAKSEHMEKEHRVTSEMPTEYVLDNDKRVQTVERSRLLQVEEVMENWYSSSDFVDRFPVISKKVSETFVLPHMVQDDLQLGLVVGKQFPCVQSIYGTSAILLDVFEGLSTGQMGCLSSVSECSPMKFKVMQVRGLLPDHVIIVAVLSDVSQIGLLDQAFKYDKSTQQPWTGPIHRAATIDMVF